MVRSNVNVDGKQRSNHELNKNRKADIIPPTEKLKLT